MYLGSSTGMETRLIPPSGIPCFFVPMASPFSPRGAAVTAAAVLRAAMILRRVRPRVVVATGGYVSTAAAVAARLQRVPLVLVSPDIHAGRALRVLAPLAARIAVVAPEAAMGLPQERVAVTGYPLRPEFEHACRTRGREQFGIGELERVLLVFGGSQGARRINVALAAILPSLLPLAHVIHIAGEDRVAEAERAAHGLNPALLAQYHLVPYLHGQEMADALAAADLAICRAGGSVLAELPATGTPAILAPFPDPAVHQRENADFLAAQGAALVLADARLEAELLPTVRLLLDDGPRLDAMAIAARSLARPHATQAIVTLLREVAA